MGLTPVARIKVRTQTGEPVQAQGCPFYMSTISFAGRTKLLHMEKQSTCKHHSRMCFAFSRFFFNERVENTFPLFLLEKLIMNKLFIIIYFLKF